MTAAFPFMSAGCARARALGRAVVRWLPLASRIVAAVLGGYGVAALVSVAAVAWSASPVEGVMAGMLLSFLAYAAAVVWVFAARSATRAWAGLVTVALPLAALAWLVARGAA
ncbi:MAG: hypothetical protein GAK30_00596 [Paracidovorax wautersii]|uniref:Iron uptake protein n=1 Tax=Paracidovorax wautersii TaxID=1177982 RepID=A0A7V8FRL5_9BURK|nr:MAG: hypothetical protein GAK30_00596 [Paracidovorax wautersii]